MLAANKNLASVPASSAEIRYPSNKQVRKAGKSSYFLLLISFSSLKKKKKLSYNRILPQNWTLARTPESEPLGSCRRGWGLVSGTLNGFAQRQVKGGWGNRLCSLGSWLSAYRGRWIFGLWLLMVGRNYKWGVSSVAQRVKNHD